MRDLGLALDEPLALRRRAAPNLPRPPHRPDVAERVAEWQGIATRMAGRGATMAIQRPFAVACIVAFLWASLQASGNFLTQGKSHPQPLFARQDSVKAKAGQPVGEKAIDDVIAAFSAREGAGPPGGAKGQDAGNLVALVQGELARLGSYTGAVDGIAGSRTENAIRDYERRSGLAITGQPSQQLLARLRREPANEAGLPHRRPAAARPDDVQTITAVQRRLADMAYFQGKPSGQLSRETRAAIEKFQRDRALRPTGEIDPGLLRELAKTGGPLR